MGENYGNKINKYGNKNMNKNNKKLSKFINFRSFPTTFIQADSNPRPKFCTKMKAPPCVENFQKNLEKFLKIFTELNG